MKQAKIQQKKQFIQTEKKLEKKHYRIIIGLMIFGVAYYYFIEPKTIGHDVKYSIYIVGLPTIIGMLILGIYRRLFLTDRFVTNKGIILSTFIIFFYLLQGLIFSYLSFGQIAKISWDLVNERVARQNQKETLTCDITMFKTRGRPSIDFQFNGNHESFKVTYTVLKEYKVEDPSNYKITIEGRKGIWNYYLVDDWTISKK